MKKNYLILFIVLIGMIQPLYGESDEFNRIIEGYLSVKTIKASITQYIYPGDGSAEVYSGNYFAASGGFIRIDYIRPERQIIVVNDTGLYWYYPGRKLLFLAQKKERPNGSIPVLMDMIPPDNLKNIDVARQGMKFYSFFQIAEVYSITSKKNRTKMVLLIDPVTKVIKRKFILDESDHEIVKEEYLDYACTDGICVPSKIEFMARTSNGVMHTLTEYSNMEINSNMDKDFFKFNVTPEMKVRVFSDR